MTSDTKYGRIIDLMSYETSEFRRIHEILLNRCEHYLFVSSYRVFADTGTASITERSARLLDVSDDNDYLATDEYALAKARQEDILRGSESSNWTILRPCITYSCDRFQFGTLEANTICYCALQHIPVIMAREILRKTTTMTWAGDVARLIAKLVLNEKARWEDSMLWQVSITHGRKLRVITRSSAGLKLSRQTWAYIARLLERRIK